MPVGMGSVGCLSIPVNSGVRKKKLQLLKGRFVVQNTYSCFWIERVLERPGRRYSPDSLGD